MIRAIVNKPSPLMADCALTFVERQPINYERAVEQHKQYCDCLAKLGAIVKVLDINQTSPDGVFVEDTAIVLDELAIITPMGTPSRCGEIPAIRSEIAQFRELSTILPPASLEGGDVLRVGHTLYVGETSRTDSKGINALRELIVPLGYRVITVPVPGCLHLKTCVTALDPETFLINSAWLDPSPFKKFRLIEAHSTEPWGANTLSISGRLLLNAAYPRTADSVETLGYDTARVDISEFVKAEAGLTCMSLLFSEGI